MKTFVIATLLGLFLSPPALASNADCAQQIRSHSSEAASGYIYVNRLDAPQREPGQRACQSSRKIVCALVSAGKFTGGRSTLRPLIFIAAV